MQLINECLKRTSDENTIYDLLNDALDIAADLQGKEGQLATSITCSPNSRPFRSGWF